MHFHFIPPCICGEGWKTSSPKNACVGGYDKCVVLIFNIVLSVFTFPRVNDGDFSHWSTILSCWRLNLQISYSTITSRKDFCYSADGPLASDSNAVGHQNNIIYLQVSTSDLPLFPVYQGRENFSAPTLPERVDNFVNKFNSVAGISWFLEWPLHNFGWCSPEKHVVRGYVATVIRIIWYSADQPLVNEIRHLQKYSVQLELNQKLASNGLP